MASNWISDVQWDGNRPYTTFLMDGPWGKKGDRSYIAPASVHPSNDYGRDPRLLAWAQGNQAPGQSLLKERGVWNSKTGKWDQGANWSNIGSMAVGGLIAAPFVAPALAGLGGGGAATTPAATTAAATTTAGTTGGAVASGGLWGTGLTIADLISGGANWFDKIFSANAASSAAAANDDAMKAALEFAKQQYADTTAREQARWDATEARRVPYRQASQDVLREFRKLLGLD